MQERKNNFRKKEKKEEQVRRISNLLEDDCPEALRPHVFLKGPERRRDKAEISSSALSCEPATENRRRASLRERRARFL
jgi:hypothetical protein